MPNWVWSINVFTPKRSQQVRSTPKPAEHLKRGFKPKLLLGAQQERDMHTNLGIDQ